MHSNFQGGPRQFHKAIGLLQERIIRGVKADRMLGTHVGVVVAKTAPPLLSRNPRRAQVKVGRAATLEQAAIPET
eukprot:5027984-Pyramimonas_sp.AAC.1